MIRVGNEIGKFAKIRLRVLENDIHINELKVVYANGESDTLAVDADIPKNSRTNWIDLRGDRFIKEIQMVYRSRPSFNGQARIEVFGQYAPGWLGPQGEGRKYNQGWVLLGAQTAGFVGFDKDIIPVGSNEGGFRRVRVTVRDRAITLNEVKVIYVDGYRGNDSRPHACRCRRNLRSDRAQRREAASDRSYRSQISITVLRLLRQRQGRRDCRGLGPTLLGPDTRMTHNRSLRGPVHIRPSFFGAARQRRRFEIKCKCRRNAA